MQNTGGPVASWFQNLLLFDPRCNNDSCIAFKNGHTASQNQISWASQFLYGHYVVWIYVGLTGVFAILFLKTLLMDLRPQPRTTKSPSLVQKLKAFARKFTYRRISGPIGTYLALPSFGIITIVTVSIAGTFIMPFIQHPYYRQLREFGSPPLGVRTGLMAAAMIPLNVALAGKVKPIIL
jgi:hypothetical protein